MKENERILENIKNHLNDFEKNVDIVLYDSITSTNTYAKEIAKDVYDRKIIIAKTQTQGRGRLGRTFYSPNKTGIYMSMIIRPDIDITQCIMFTTIAAVSVIEAIADVTGKKAYIKWVNDIFYNKRKICGILTESSMKVGSSKADYVVVGIGLNLFEMVDMPNDIKNIASSLFKQDEEVQNDVYERLIATIINKFFYYANQFPKKDFVEKYKAYSFVIGKEVLVLSSGDEIKAKVLDIDSECRLVVMYEDGKTEVLSSGEISIRV